MNLFFEGFFLQASLVLALGAQNLFVLESGLQRRRQYFVAAICSVCDAALIAIGVAGAASVFVQFPFLKIGFGVLGVGFLLYYGVKKSIEAFVPEKISVATQALTYDLRKITILTLSFTLLNPHVYLDTLILIGGYSAKYSELEDRVAFGSGAAALSVFWFFALAAFASSLNSLLKSPKAVRVISFLSAAILIVLSFKLGSEVYGWLAWE